jgi:hypothetical protein
LLVSVASSAMVYSQIPWKLFSWRWEFSSSLTINVTELLYARMTINCNFITVGSCSVFFRPQVRQQLFIY